MPTFEKVESFLHYTDLKWDETVAVLPIAHRNTTVWHDRLPDYRRCGPQQGADDAGGGGYATVKIDLPEQWDSLMAELGYRPLEEFR